MESKRLSIREDPPSVLLKCLDSKGSEETVSIGLPALSKEYLLKIIYEYLWNLLKHIRTDVDELVKSIMADEPRICDEDKSELKELINGIYLNLSIHHS